MKIAHRFNNYMYNNCQVVKGMISRVREKNSEPLRYETSHREGDLISLEILPLHAHTVVGTIRKRPRKLSITVRVNQLDYSSPLIRTRRERNTGNDRDERESEKTLSTVRHKYTSKMERKAEK